jgi:hypothetical protein
MILCRMIKETLFYSLVDLDLGKINRTDDNVVHPLYGNRLQRIYFFDNDIRTW